MERDNDGENKMILRNRLSFYRGRQVVLVLLLLVVGGLVHAEGAAKVICAGRAATPPVIDGVLDDACWQNADWRDDFIPLGSTPLERTTMRLVSDDRNLYVGVECVWKNVSRLQALVTEARAKPDFTGGFVDINRFAGCGSLELFFDPGATMANHYQVLINAAGQICGQYKGNWDPFKTRPSGAVKITDTGWTAELVFPDQGLHQGDLQPGREWGFNMVRNDETPVGIWKDMGAVFNEPKQFARLVIGDGPTWWRGTWEKGVVPSFSQMSTDAEAYGKTAPLLTALIQEVGRRMPAMEETVQTAGLTTSGGFLQVYAKYAEFSALFHRLEALYATTKLTTGPLAETEKR